VFEVVGRSKSEKMTKEGQLEIAFKVSLKSTNAKHKLTITDANPSLLSMYPLGGEVLIKIGVCNQTTLEKNLKQAVKDAAQASGDEAVREARSAEAK
jgi:hypothetical protein